MPTLGASLSQGRRRFFPVLPSPLYPFLFPWGFGLIQPPTLPRVRSPWWYAASRKLPSLSLLPLTSRVPSLLAAPPTGLPLGTSSPTGISKQYLPLPPSPPHLPQSGATPLASPHCRRLHLRPPFQHRLHPLQGPLGCFPWQFANPLASPGVTAAPNGRPIPWYGILSWRPSATPAFPASSPPTSLTPDGSGNILFHAYGIPDNSYDIQQSSNTAFSPFVVIATVVAGPSGVINYTIPSPPAGSSFRLAVATLAT